MDNLQEKLQKNLRICQYLGGPHDLDTFYHYPSDQNRCFRPDPKRFPSQTHQSEYCLTARHVQCPVFQANWNGEFPSEIESRTAGGVPRTRSRRGFGRLSGAQRAFLIGLAVILATLAFIAFLGWRTPLVRIRTINIFRELRGQEPLDRLPAVADPTGTPDVEPTVVPTNTPRPTNTFVPTATASPSETPMPSPTSAPTNTPFPTPGPGLETPFGPDASFVIHVVESGESFSAIAQQYDTTAEVLQAINPIVEGASLWVGRQLVVPIGATDPEALPAFDVLLTTETTTLTEIAALYNTDTELVRYYNQLGDSDVIPAGRWLILPLIEEE